MSDIARLGIKIESDSVAQASGRLDEFTAKGKEAERATDSLRETSQTATSGLGGFASKFGSIAAGAAAATVALKKLADLGADMIRAFGEQEVASAKLSAVLQATGGAAGLTAGQLESMAGELQGLTGVGDEAVLGLQATMLTFRNITGETFGRAIKTAIDMGQIFGSVESAALQLGKALNDPAIGITALQRVGVTFSQAQKDLISSLVETNRVAEAQDVILSELEHQLGGVAEATAATATGSLTKLNNAIGDMKERGGEAILTFAKPFLDWLTNVITKSNEAASATKNLREVLEASSVEELKATDPGAALQEIDRQIEAVTAQRDALERNKQLLMDVGRLDEDSYKKSIANYNHRIEGLTRERRQIELKNMGLRQTLEAEQAIREEEARQQAAREEADRRDKVAAEYRLQAAREYSMSIIELEGSALEIIEAKRTAALDEARKSYVETGKEIELINRYFDILREKELSKETASQQTIKALQEELTLYGATAAEILRYTLETQGATEAEIAQALAIRDKLDALAAESQIADEVARVLERSKTELDRYAEELENLYGLYRSGRISADQYRRALEALKEEYGDGVKAVEEYQSASARIAEDLGNLAQSQATSVIHDLGRAIGEAASGQKTWGDALGEWAASITSHIAEAMFYTGLAFVKRGQLEIGLALMIGSGLITLGMGISEGFSGGGSSGAPAPGAPETPAETYYGSQADMPTFGGSRSLAPSAGGGRASATASANVTVHNYSGEPVETRESGTGGMRQVEVIIGSVVRKQLAAGAFDRDMKQAFGVSRRAT